MPKLRLLSSTDVIKALETFGFTVIGQKGSHIKLARYTVLQKQVLTVPNNKSLPKGMVKAIYNQVSRFVPQEELQAFFYTE
jgi:predicted RNA binding protein YcfA (HicA-like mRNA interferase family)